MEENIYNIKKFQKSIHNQQCVGPCYKKDTRILHPLYFELITSNEHSFCPVTKWVYNNNEQLLDACYEIGDENKEKYNTSDLLFPYVNFNTQLFLQSFYNIISFSNGIEWLNNNLHLNHKTLIRNFDLIFETFADSIDIIEFSDIKLTDFLIYIIKDRYINEIFIHLTNYIIINKDEVFLKKNNEKDNDESIKIKTNYIIKKFIIQNVIKDFLIYYYDNKKFNFSELYSNINFLIKNFINYIINEIEKLIK
jgi:hypothetical protein